MQESRVEKTLKHFGYEKAAEIIGATQHNKNPFKLFSEVVAKMDLDKKLKTRIVFDYDPNFEHCLTQIFTFDKQDNQQ